MKQVILLRLISLIHHQLNFLSPLNLNLDKASVHAFSKQIILLLQRAAVTTFVIAQSYTLPSFFAFSAAFGWFFKFAPSCALCEFASAFNLATSAVGASPVAGIIAVTTMPTGVAVPEANATAEATRRSALITCLPKQPSQPNLKRAQS